MADNVELNAGSGGSTLAAASLSVSGDTALVQMVGCGILSGSEGSWSLSQFVGGAGAVSSGVQRVTLASDDPAVVDLAAIEVLITSGNALLTTIDADTSKIPSQGTAAMAASTPVTIASDDTLTTAVKTAAEAIQTAVEGTLTVGSHAVTNAGTFAVQASQSGTWNIGTVTTVSSVTAIANALPAGTNTIGGTISQASTSVAYDGTTACTIKRASGLAASGTTAMVAAVVGKKIRVLAMFLKATSATVTNVYVANADNDLIGDATNPIPLAVDADGDNDSGFVMPWNPGGWFETDTANEALNLILSAAQDVIYALTYIEVD